ncbi:MAG: aminotransferase class IV [Bdellovibrionales bacterium]|nr:aminotransferase class IV [Bdellovibrionales bacterium]
MKAMASVDGVITPAAEARISLFDRGFLYGDSIYEVVRTYQGVPFFHEEHLDRLENSARLARMKLSQTRQEIKDAISTTVRASNPGPGEDVFVRYTVTRGGGALDISPSASPGTSLVILVKEIPNWNPVFYSHGVRLWIPSIRRNPPLALDPNIKSGNYLNSVIAVAEAQEEGYHDAFLLSIDHKLTEASNSNVGLVIGGEVVFPLHEPGTLTGNLRGLTKQAVAEACRRLGVKYTERPLDVTAIAQADEAFVCSATREVMPVKEIAGTQLSTRAFPAGGGPLVRTLREEYKKFVADWVAARREEALF